MKGKFAVALSAAALLTACTQEPPVNHTKQYMADFVEPQAQIYWKSAGAISDENGITDLTPTTPEGWKKALDAASSIVKAGEELQTPKYAEGRGEGWIRLAKGLVERGKAAEEAARAQDGDKVFEAGAYMYDVCKACHDTYPAVEENAEASI